MRTAIVARFFAVALSGMLIPPVFAGVPADGPSTLGTAAAKVGEGFAQGMASGKPPRMSDPAYKPSFDALFDRQAVFGDHPYTKEDIQPLLQVFNVYFNLSKAYLTFGGTAGGEGNNLADNDFSYQDELSRLAGIMLYTGGAVSEAMADFAASDRTGQAVAQAAPLIKDTRGGVGQILRGIFNLLDNPRYTNVNKTILVEALAEAGPHLAAVMPLAERSSAVTAANDVLIATPPESQGGMATFIQAMQSKECRGLCKIE
jgi:hypothetical protein